MEAVDHNVPTLPNDEHAERSVLAAAILQRSAEPLRRVRDAFFSRCHRLIADAAIAIADGGHVPELVALRAELERRGLLEQAGGHSYLAGLLEGALPSSNIDSYIEVVENRAWRRAVMQRGYGLIEAAGTATDRDIVELIEDLTEERTPSLSRIAPVDLYGPDIEPETPRWFVENLLPRPGLVLIWAKPGGGKTFMILNVVHQLLFATRADRLFGHPELTILERPRRALWVATEETAGRLRHRAEMVVCGLEAQPGPDRLLFRFALDAKRSLTLNDLPALLSATPVDLVVLDSLTGLRPKLVGGHVVAWDCDNDAANTYCLMLRSLATEHNATIILVHHTGRDVGKGYRGPTDWWASADVMFGLVPESRDTLKLKLEKCRDGHLLPAFRLRPSWGPEGYRVEFEGDSDNEAPAGKSTEVLEYLRSHGPVPQARVFNEVPGARSTLQDALKKLTLSGHACWTGDNENRSPIIAPCEDAGDEVPDVTAGADDE